MRPRSRSATSGVRLGLECSSYLAQQVVVRVTVKGRLGAFGAQPDGALVHALSHFLEGQAGGHSSSQLWQHLCKECTRCHSKASALRCCSCASCSDPARLINAPGEERRQTGCPARFAPLNTMVALMPTSMSTWLGGWSETSLGSQAHLRHLSVQGIAVCSEIPRPSCSNLSSLPLHSSRYVHSALKGCILDRTTS